MENPKDQLERITRNADKTYMLTKAAEECMELAMVLIQQVNKPTKDYKQNIEEEIAHVDIRIEMLKNLFNRDNIKDEKKKKLSQFKKWEEVDRYKNM